MSTSPRNNRRALVAGLAAAALTALPGSAMGADPAPAAIVRGIVKAVQQATISSELTNRAAAVHFREGQSFAAGDVLVEFDCRRQKARLMAAQAQQHEMQLSVDKFEMLLKTQSAGRNDAEVAQARLDRAKAEADELRGQLDDCTITAPFDGRVLELSLQPHESAQPGKPIITIVSSRNLEVEIVVPSNWVRDIGPGTAFSFQLDDTHATLAAEIVRQAAAVDPISQTIKFVGIFKGDQHDVLPGMSGTAVFPRTGG